jgi:hypothetical protein
LPHENGPWGRGAQKRPTEMPGLVRNCWWFAECHARFVSRTLWFRRDSGPMSPGRVGLNPAEWKRPTEPDPGGVHAVSNAPRRQPSQPICWGSLRHPRSAQARGENVSQREADDRLALDTPSACSNVFSPGRWRLPRRRSRGGGFVARALRFRRSAMRGSAITKWIPSSRATTSPAVGVFISTASGWPT